MLHKTLHPKISLDIPIDFMLEYSEAENTRLISATFGGDKWNPLEEMDSISQKILETAISDSEYKYLDEMNEIHAVIRK